MSHADSDERFLVQLCPEVEPTLHRARDLGPFLQRVAEAAHYGWHADTESLRVWRWAGPGELEELQLACVEPAEFDTEDDYAHPVWAELGADGTAYIAISVRIDGRA